MAICSSGDVLIAMFAKNHPHKLKCESFELNKHVPVSVMNYINIILYVNILKFPPWIFPLVLDQKGEVERL